MSGLKTIVRRELIQIFNLWKLNYRTRFTGTRIGRAWIMLSPMLQMGVYIFAFGFVFAGTGADPLEHVLWLICGYGPWQAISEGIMSAANSLVSNKAILKNFDVKSHYFPIAASMMGLPSICVVLIFSTVLLIATGLGISFFILWLLLAIPLTFLLIMGIGLCVSAIVVFLRDIVQVLSVLLMTTMFFTPILYYPERLPQFLQPLVILNPFYQVVQIYRCGLYYQKNASLPGVLILLVWIGLFWLTGLQLFRKLRGSFESAL